MWHKSRDYLEFPFNRKWYSWTHVHFIKNSECARSMRENGRGPGIEDIFRWKICFTEFYQKNFFMNAKGRVKEDRAFKFYQQESSLRGMSYHARRTTHDAQPTTQDPRRTTQDARPTTHDAQPTTHAPTACSRAPRARSGSKASPCKSTISWVYYILGNRISTPQNAPRYLTG